MRGVRDHDVQDRKTVLSSLDRLRQFLGLGITRHSSRTGQPNEMVPSMQGPHPPALTLLQDVSNAHWVEDSLGSRFAHVEALLPRGYAAYARVFHSAMTGEFRPVRWSEVAEWSGRATHSLMAFEGISEPKPGFGPGDRPWAHDPEAGRMAPEDLAELVRLLSRFTGDADRCYFAVWDSYGGLSAGSAGMLSSSGGIPISPDTPVHMAADTINL